MILTAILNIFNIFLSGVINLLPVGHLPVGIVNGITYFWYLLNEFSYVFPVSTLFAALLVLFGFDIAMLIIHFITFVIKKIPFLHVK